MSGHYISKAPGRICLFGDHQDYLQLPVIACAINRYITINARPNQSNLLNIYKLDLGEQDCISLDHSHEPIAKGDFLRLAIRVLNRYGCKPNRGFDIHISGDIPINAGLSSSSALTVAWIQFLVTAFGINQNVTPELLARLAFETEVLEQGGSGGKMDQFTIGLGQMIYLETNTEHVTSLPTALDGMIIGVSGVAKDTDGTLAHLKQLAIEAIEQVRAQFPDFQITTTKEADISSYLPCIECTQQPIFQAAVRNYLITQKALSALQQQRIDPDYIGNLINSHHQLLRDNLQITVPLIDDMIEAALHAGAQGAKIVGSGGGGCIVALASDKKRQAVVDAIKKAGAIDAFQVIQSGGVSLFQQ